MLSTLRVGSESKLVLEKEIDKLEKQTNGEKQPKKKIDIVTIINKL